MQLFMFSIKYFFLSNLNFEFQICFCNIRIEFLKIAFFHFLVFVILFPQKISYPRIYINNAYCDCPSDFAGTSDGGALRHD